LTDAHPGQNYGSSPNPHIVSDDYVAFGLQRLINDGLAWIHAVVIGKEGAVWADQYPRSNNNVAHVSR
jgi:hypothetical protein